MNYIKVTYGAGNSFIKSTFEDNSTYVKTSVNSTFIKVAYDGGSSGLDAERLRTKVYNVTGATLVKGTVVYINGTHGNLPSVTKAIATGDATSAQTLGLVMEDILDNKSGYIIIAGKLSDLDTQAFANGVQLYLSSTVAGTYTTTKQYAPAHLVYVGIVNRSHPTQGEIEVKIQNGYEADEIHDFAVRNPLNNQGIFFNSSNNLWEKKYVSDALGFTPANAATTLTINGVTYDLSTSRTWTVAGGISGSGASGQVTYWTGASAVSGSNNLFWDNTNGRLGIGTNAPATPIDLLYNNPSTSLGSLRVKNTNSAGINEAQFLNNNDQGGGFGTYGTTFGGVAFRNNFVVNATKSIIFLSDSITPTGGTSTISFITGGYNVAAAMTLNGLGRLSLGTTSDLGVRLGVIGDTLLRGSGADSASTALTVQNSSSTNLLTVRNDGFVNITNTLLNGLSVNSSNFTTRISINNTNANPNAGFALQTFGVTNWSLATYKPSGTTNASFVFYNDRTSTDSLFINGDNNNVGINTNNPTARLDVRGDTLLRGSGATSATTALTVQNSDNRIIIRATNNGVLQIGNINANSIYPFSSSIGTPDIQGTSLAISTNLSTSGNGIGIRNAQVTNRDYTSGDGNFVRLYEGYAPTSGTGTWQQLILTPQINQTGGANGITRGLYINPTLTSAFDFRAIETTGGSVKFGWNRDAATTVEVSNTSNTASASASFNVTSAAGGIWMAKNSFAAGIYKIINAGDAYIYGTAQFGDIAILNDYSSGAIKFAAGGGSVAHLTIKSNGRINMSSLPTSATGLNTGDLWNDAGTIKIV